VEHLKKCYDIPNRIHLRFNFQVRHVNNIKSKKWWQQIININPNFTAIANYRYRDVIKGKAGKAAALPKFSDTLTPSQPEGGKLCSPIVFACLQKFLEYGHAMGY
jgi:hypothetical protein